MSGTTRSGLVPTPKRNIKYIKRRKNLHADSRMSLKFEAITMPLSLRPFDGLFNPFSKGCSILCNHPAPTSVKDVINQLKASLAIEGKCPTQVVKNKPFNEQLLPYESDNIPEDLFRRYAETDSRPMTPTPTVTSNHTRTSAGSFYRRCITPEWGKHENIQRKKIILDLRRTHSQETLNWKPTSELTLSAIEDDKKPKSASANEIKMPRRQPSNELRPKSSLTIANLPHDNYQHDDVEPSKTCINAHDLNEDARRGKKRKKIKPVQATTTFNFSEDPETQVAALGPDSQNVSTRPSLIPNVGSLLPKDRRETDRKPILLKSSFLTEDAFQTLKTNLSEDLIENTFGKYLNRALREAIKYMSKPAHGGKLVEEVDKVMLISTSKMPRKFSKSATRFDVPMNLAMLKTMTALDYLSKYVWVSQQRTQLYKRVFLKHLKRSEEPDNELILSNDEAVLAEYKERTMVWHCLPQALEDVLEFHGTEENVRDTLNCICYDQYTCGNLNFRVWCGIVSFAERLALSRSACTNGDSCDELEKSDFSSMEQIIEQFEIPEQLRNVFKIIQIAHKSNH